MSDPRDGDEPPRVPPEVGSVGEEAVKLLGAVTEWARDRDLGSSLGGLAEQAAAAVSEVDQHLATGAAECTYCPVCRTVHVVRQTSPEVRAHLATAASSLLQAAAGVLASLPQPGSSPGAPGAGSAFETIDLDGDDS